MSITQPQIADHAKTGSSPQREIGFSFRPSKSANRTTRASAGDLPMSDRAPLAGYAQTFLLTGNTALKLGLIRKKQFAFCLFQPFR